MIYWPTRKEKKREKIKTQITQKLLDSNDKSLLQNKKESFYKLWSMVVEVSWTGTALLPEKNASSFLIWFKKISPEKQLR